MESVSVVNYDIIIQRTMTIIQSSLVKSSQFCGSGNTLARLVAYSLSRRTRTCVKLGKRILLIRTHYEPHLIQDATLEEYNLPVDTAVSETRYLRVTKSKLIDNHLSLENIPRRKPMTYHNKSDTFLCYHGEKVSDEDT